MIVCEYEECGYGCKGDGEGRRERKRTNKTSAKQAVRLKFLSMGNHSLSEHVDGQHLLLIVALLPLGHGLDIGVHRRVELIHACWCE